MRAGLMSSRLRVLDAGTEIGKLWADVRPPLDVSEQTSLRESGQTKILVRPHYTLRPGMLLEGGGQLYVIDGMADRLVKKQDIHLSCTRLLGRPGVYRQANTTETTARVFVATSTPYVGLDGQLMQHRYRLEIPSIDRPAPWHPGDKIIVDGVEYPLTGLAEDGDNGLIVAYTS
ncbi:head-tail adaptor protein [Marinobacter subterrani]|uniref:Uncharacterized protein n=1 Tax=Marinobacter subterrani TaxID=1658765 RepID=A0A0J7JBM4_9GAMM|nr:hypothetical protein [Marinobacter subterrani]KMQ75299.1 hypothetical protein Msub_11501 [Marinobacter subterrani]